MDVIIVDGRQVIKCEHCKGTTLCQHADWDDAIKQNKLRCSLCGDGILAVKGWGWSKRVTPPVCRVCGGRGYNIV
jgi:hypothetical protein